jgi:hypothetical protein
MIMQIRKIQRDLQKRVNSRPFVYPVVVILFSLGVLLSACSETSTPTQAALPTPQISTTRVPTATQIPSDTPVSVELSFDPATYQDQSAGFELDYPASWTADPPIVGGTRGYIAQITSWSRTPGELPEFIPEGETILAINVLRWDPINELEQFTDSRRQAWEASGHQILQENELILPGDWRALEFLVETQEETVYYLLATVGERYLLLSGTGDLEIISEISSTLRQIESSQ